MSALIYFSYGMTKSGSTLAYQLARCAFIEAGFDQPRLSTAAVENRRHINFVGGIDPARAEAIRTETHQIGHPIAFKTHARPEDDVVKMLQNGEAFAHATYRDPRDMALSMLDHGKRAREMGKAAFSEYFEIDDTIDNLRHQSNTLLAWLSLPNVRPIYYEDLAFNMEQTAAILTAELGVDVPVHKVIKKATQDNFTQKNKAVSARHETEMSQETSQRFRRVFAPFFDRLIDNRDRLPLDGHPALDPEKPLCDWSA